MINEGLVFRSVALPDLKAIAERVVKELGEFKIWLFYGEMGSGKTSLIKEICREAGVEDGMSSPTFSIVNEYETTSHGQAFHFDFYRIKSETEAYDIGTDEYLYSGAPCFIEWPEKIPSLIPPKFAAVDLKVENDTKRTIVISFHDGKEENRI
jgi:tRNA threonylcarbamoyladenosine biosynthesis protein TsaE